MVTPLFALTATDVLVMRKSEGSGTTPPVFLAVILYAETDGDCPERATIASLQKRHGTRGPCSQVVARRDARLLPQMKED